MKVLYLVSMVAFATLLYSCAYDMDDYRKAKVVDENDAPIEGVRVNPSPLAGRASKSSSAEGFLYVPKGGFFYLVMEGYKSKMVKRGDRARVYELTKGESHTIEGREE